MRLVFRGGRVRPRLPVPDLTDEDFTVWWRVIKRQGNPPGHTLFYTSVAADRRDASLMLVLGWWRVQRFARRWRFAAHAADFPGLASGDDWWPPRRADITTCA